MQKTMMRPERLLRRKEDLSMSKIMDLRNKRNALWEQTKDFLEAHRGENGLVDAASLEQYDKMAADVQALGGEIKRLEDQAEIDAEMSKPTSKPVVASPTDGAKKPAMKGVASDEYNGAFWDMMRGAVTPDVRDALSIGENEQGGYTVPDEFERQLVKALEENNIFRRMAHVIRTSSGTRKIPIANDVMEASWIDEGEEIPETNTKFSQTTLSAYKLGTMIKVSNELLHDSAFDIAGYIAERFGVAMGNAEEKAFLNGTGEKQPTGLLNDINGAQLGVTAAGETAVTFDEIFDLYYSLKAPYRRRAAFLCNEALVHQLMLLKDKNDNYLWKPSLDIAQPDTILGRPIYTSTFMPAIAAGEKALCFGDYSYYWVADRENRTFKRLNELYARTDQVGFLTTQRVDGKLILPETVKYLKLAGTKAAG